MNALNLLTILLLVKNNIGSLKLKRPNKNVECLFKKPLLIFNQY